MDVTESILTSIKKLVGITEADESFDADLIIDINAVFVILHQLGIGPGGFTITGKQETWAEYLPENQQILGLVKSYVHKKVKLMFDTSTMTSSMIEVINRLISEDEWRLNVAVDPETN